MKIKKLPKILAQPSSLISLPARVQNYLDSRSGKLEAPYLLPLSCSLVKGDTPEGLFKSMIWIKRGAGVKMIFDEMPTFTSEDNPHVIKVQDSLITDPNCDGDMGIVEALIAKSKEGYQLDFSNLRPKGSPCTGGITASGRGSFEYLSSAVDAYRYEPTMHNLLYLVGLINRVMIQGGYKKGIIISSFKIDHPRIQEYLAVDLAMIPGSLKREVRFSDDPIQDWATTPDVIKKEIVEARTFSSLLLSKERKDKNGNTLYTNVCEGIYLKENDSCLIIRIPLGRLEVSQIRKAYKDAFQFGKALWKHWHSEADGVIEYPFNSSEIDRQIAIDPFGLANLLARLKIKYQEFIEAMNQIVDNPSMKISKKNVAYYLAKQLYLAHQDVAKLNNDFFERIFTVEPSQAHAFREKDLDGYTFARGIWAIWNKSIQRDSNHSGSEIYEYPDFETIQDQENYEDIQEEISSVWYRMMATTGLEHAISHDTYYEPSLDRITNWVIWGLPSLYYNFHAETKQVVAKTVEEVSFDGIDLSFNPVCDPTAGFCQVCGA